MNALSQDAVNWVKVDAESAGQRIDNYLLRLLKGVPKSHVYRILRSGEVRLNRKRADPTARLAEGDELRVRPDAEGMEAHTIFRRLKTWDEASLIEAELKTGRTHQIRVHLAHLEFPIAGDDKYGDFAWNKSLAKRGLKRMFLHAGAIA